MLNKLLLNEIRLNQLKYLFDLRKLYPKNFTIEKKELRLTIQRGEKGLNLKEKHKKTIKFDKILTKLSFLIKFNQILIN